MASYTNLSRTLKPFGTFCSLRCTYSTKPTPQTEHENISGEFRVFDVRSNKRKHAHVQEKYTRPPANPPREKIMPTDQDWPSVWPGPRTFHPASVPLTVRQGMDKNQKIAPPSKYANAELMKIPNFLHLTPPAVKRHCDAIKKFCTPWPNELDTDENINKHFPLKIITNDYCYSSPKIRDPKARVVTFKFPLSAMTLNNHAEDKIKRLLGERFNQETGEVTLVTDRCPMRRQNYDYNMYLLVALYYESMNVEEWEAEKQEEDMEYYDWEKNPSKKAYIALKYWPKPVDEIKIDEISLENDEKAQNYKEAVTDLFNKGETTHNLFKYKEAVLKIVF